MSEVPRTDIAVIGAGIIGICAAAQLAEAGQQVVLVDRSGISEETSSGNAGGFAFSEVLPMAHKGMLRDVPRWLLDPLGPLSIPPGEVMRLAPWLYRFWRAGSPDKYAAAVSAQAGMMRLAETEWRTLMACSNTTSMLRDYGAIELYQSEDALRADAPGWRAREQAGIRFRTVGRDELASIQPGLSPSFVRGVFLPDWRTVSDPKDLGLAVWRYAETFQARFLAGRVADIRVENDGFTLADAAGAPLVGCRRLVIAAGAWSHQLARQFGDRIPLEAERGYNTTLPKSAFDVRLQLSFHGHGFVIAPLDTGVRVGGAVELGGLRRAPNFARSRAMLAKAKRFLPGLETAGGREWMGHRPSLPDSLPVIGRARNAPNVVYAFGHGHLGLTQAAATGRLVRELILRQTPSLDLSPFSPQRF